jgi:redox-sensitive bicupin YhaK (pirin superfamily)
VPTFDVRRSGTRAVTENGWLRSRHSLSFGPHYEPDNTSFGLLIASNHDLLQPGPGYRPHRHARVEILSWPVSGVLAHADSLGRHGQVGAGMLQYLSAGSGVSHSERSASQTAPVEFVQMWLAPSAGEPADGESRYAVVDLAGPLADGGLLLAASGSRPAPVQLRQPAAELFIARAPAGSVCRLPEARYLHLYLVAGAADVAGHRLTAGDALRIRDALQVGDALQAGDAGRVGHGAGLDMHSLADAELLVWAMSASMG